MFVPAAVLVVMTLGIGLVPRLASYVKAAAETMADGGSYRSRVLESAYVPPHVPLEESAPMSGSLLRSFGTAVAAMGLAAFTLSPKWPKRKQRGYVLPIRGPLYALRAIHTGHVGDYVAFLTFGVAAVGVVLGVLVVWR